MVYVDDLPIFAKDQTTLQYVINLLENLYEVENLGPIKQLLGIEFNISRHGTILSCPQNIKTCLKRFKIFNCPNVFLPLQPGVTTSLQEMPTEKAEKDKMKEIPYRNLLDDYST